MVKAKDLKVKSTLKYWDNSVHFKAKTSNSEGPVWEDRNILVKGGHRVPDIALHCVAIEVLL